MSLKLAIIASSLSRKAGGMLEISRGLSNELARTPGLDIGLFGLADAFSEPDAPLWTPLVPHFFEVVGPRSFGYAPTMRGALNAFEADIVHQHGIWMYPSLLVHKWCARNRRPFVVTIHGMLDKWARRQSRRRKWIAEVVYQRSALASSDCLHVNSEAEYLSVRSAGYSNPICILPNGVDLPDIRQTVNDPPWARRGGSRNKALLYLGRLHPKKGLVPLLRAWGMLRGHPQMAHWALVIAGWQEGNHDRELKALTHALGISDSVDFTGPLYGQSKIAALAAADAFVLPSFSEGLPMAVLEAWAHGLPVAMTSQCNLEIGFRYHAATQMEPERHSIAGAIARLIEMTDDERRLMGARGSALVAREFGWAHVAKDLYDVFTWLLGKGERPESVRMN